MIEIRECSKAFGALQAVNNISMDIGERKCSDWLEAMAQEKVPCFEW